MRSDLAALPIDAGFAHWGVAGVYTSPDGEAVDCILIARRPDDTVSFGEIRAVVGTVVVEVRSSEVARPRRGGTFRLDGTAWVILAEPEARDPARLVWRCQAEERKP